MHLNLVKYLGDSGLSGLETAKTKGPPCQHDPNKPPKNFKETISLPKTEKSSETYSQGYRGFVMDG